MKSLRITIAILLALPLLGLLFIGGCKNGSPGDGVWSNETTNDDGTKKFKVLTTIVPLHCFTASIAEPYCEVRCLLTTRGAHGYESTIQDNRAVSSADLLIANGLKLDNFVAKLKDQSANKDLKIVWTGDEIGARGADYIQTPKVVHGDHTHPAGNDMHVWLGNEEAKLQCQVIRDALIELDPAHRAHYEKQTTALLAELDKLKDEAKELKETTGKFVTFHDSFKYFARSYLGSKDRVAGDIAGAEGEEPGTAEFDRKVNEFYKAGVKIIGREPQYRDKPAETLREALNRMYDAKVVKIILLDPLETGVPEKDYYVKKSAYIDGMRGNIQRLKEALKP